MHIKSICLHQHPGVHVLPVNVLFCVVCSDLAVDLRMRMGDWFRVVQLLKTGGGAGTYVCIALCGGNLSTVVN